MGMTLSKVQSKEATATVLWDGETCDIGYLPNKVTPDLLESVQASAETGDLAVIGALLEPVLSWWDVLDDDGARLPTTAEFIGMMPMGFLNAIMATVQEGMLPPGVGPSDAGSRPTAI